MTDALVPSGRNLPASAEEFLSKHLRKWETRGRGWELFDYPVELEPPFCSLYYLLDMPEIPVSDDGRRQTFMSGLIAGLKGHSPDNSQAIANYQKALAEYVSFLEEANEPYYCGYYTEEFLELQLILPKDFRQLKQVADNLLLSFSYLAHPVGFEVIGSREEIVIQFAVTEPDLPQVRQQLGSHLPGCFLKETSNYLTDLWINGEEFSRIVDFGLSNRFLLPLKTVTHFETDLLLTIIGALSDLRGDEVGIFQVLFQKAKNEWAQEILDSALYLDETGSSSRPLSNLAKEKVRSPLYAALIRVAGRSFHESGAWRIVKGLGAGLVSLANPAGNELIPLSNEYLPEEYHEQALLNRQSFRSGMVLNLEELVSIVHLPSALVQSEKLRREMELTKPAPSLALGHSLILGENHHQNESREVTLSESQRTKHIHVIGSSGSGKSSMLLSLIKQDLENDQGVCVIDPHGDLIDAVVENVPERRTKDVVLFDPSDAEYPIGFNILQANSELEKTLLSSDLIATFRRMSTSWGDVMDSVLANAILAFVESGRGGTLFELKRFLVEKDFRNEFLQSVRDDGVRYFWENEFPLITGKPQSSILIRLDTFLRQRLIRNIVCQQENKIDFRSVLDNRKVFLVKLSQGLIGEENSYLLGTLLVSKLYQTALSRQDSANRPYFWLYLDEFHHFITPSMESILSGVRKYNLGLVLAHQEFRQLQSRSSDVASSVLSNCYTRICFRLGDTDAEKFASGFSFFDSKALQNLGIGEAIGRVERSEYDFNLKTGLLPKVPPDTAGQRRQAVVRSSREIYGTPKAGVEANLFVMQAKQAAIQVAEADSREKTFAEKPKAEPVRVKDQQQDSAMDTPSAKQRTKTAVPDTNIDSSSETGNEHRYLQSVVKRIGENYGFVATLERQVFGGVGKVDVALENNFQKIACEVAVTNKAEYELRNIQKCLASGFDRVVVISPDTKHLGNIRQMAEGLVSPEQLKKVHFLEPENFHLLLHSLQDQSPASAAEEKDPRVKGYKIRTKIKEASQTETETRKQSLVEIVSNLIRRKGKK